MSASLPEKKVQITVWQHPLPCFRKLSGEGRAEGFSRNPPTGELSQKQCYQPYWQGKKKKSHFKNNSLLIRQGRGFSLVEVNKLAI